ncbi:MAG: hypothetical protein ACK52U_10450, partial [Synechococcaceae cyanobacterium]
MAFKKMFPAVPEPEVSVVAFARLLRVMVAASRSSTPPFPEPLVSAVIEPAPETKIEGVDPVPIRMSPP